MKNNYVAKHLRKFNRPSVMVDRKKAAKKGYVKHKEKEEKGAVLLTSLVILSILSSVSLISLSQITSNEKALFATHQHFKSQEVAESGTSEVLNDIISDCEEEITRVGEVDNGDQTGYEYKIERMISEKFYKITTTGNSLDKFKATIEIGFFYESGKSKSTANNGWGNGDQDAPGNSLTNNNAENSIDGKQAPKGIQKKQTKPKNCGINILFWSNK